MHLKCARNQLNRADLAEFTCDQCREIANKRRNQTAMWGEVSVANDTLVDDDADESGSENILDQAFYVEDEDSQPTLVQPLNVVAPAANAIDVDEIISLSSETDSEGLMERLNQPYCLPKPTPSTAPPPEEKRTMNLTQQEISTQLRLWDTQDQFRDYRLYAYFNNNP